MIISAPDSIIQSARIWWNGRHVGLRNQCASVQVQVLLSAPLPRRISLFSGDFLLVAFNCKSFCRDTVFCIFLSFCFFCYVRLQVFFCITKFMRRRARSFVTVFFFYSVTVLFQYQIFIVCHFVLFKSYESLFIISEKYQVSDPKGQSYPIAHKSYKCIQHTY